MKVAITNHAGAYEPHAESELIFSDGDGMLKDSLVLRVSNVDVDMLEIIDFLVPYMRTHASRNLNRNSHSLAVLSDLKKKVRDENNGK